MQRNQNWISKRRETGLSRSNLRGALGLVFLAGLSVTLLAAGCAKPRIEYRCPFGELNSEAWAEVDEGKLDEAPELESFLMEVARECGWE